MPSLSFLILLKCLSLALQLEYWNTKKSNFILPTLGLKLESLSVELHRGKGFFTLRGLDPLAFTRVENIVIFLGISSYIAGRIGRQSLDPEGRMLSEYLHERHITVVLTCVRSSHYRSTH